MSFALPDKPSIAVLPFANMSSSRDQELFVRWHLGRSHNRAIALLNGNSTSQQFLLSNVTPWKIFWLQRGFCKGVHWRERPPGKSE